MLRAVIWKNGGNLLHICGGEQKLNLNQSTEKFIALCSQLCVDSQSYTAANVRHHNRAMQKLSVWAEELNTAPVAFQIEVYTQLLQATDAVIQLNAASFALKYGICKDGAILVLEHLQRGTNPLIAFDAEMTLRVWRGEVMGRTL